VGVECALLVGSRQRDGCVEHVIQLQAAFRDHLRELPTLNELQGEEVDVLPVLDRKNFDDIGMV
jgi:hypothetical protein